MAVNIQRIQTDDRRVALAITCLRPDRTAVDLTDLTVSFEMYSAQGVEKIAKTTDNVVVDSATDGQVHYDWADGDTDTEGTYFCYFLAEAASGEIDTFPSEAGELQVIIRSAS